MPRAGAERSGERQLSPLPSAVPPQPSVRVSGRSRAERTEAAGDAPSVPPRPSSPRAPPPRVSHGCHRPAEVVPHPCGSLREADTCCERPCRSCGEALAADSARRRTAIRRRGTRSSRGFGCTWSTQCAAASEAIMRPMANVTRATGHPRFDKESHHSPERKGIIHMLATCHRDTATA